MVLRWPSNLLTCIIVHSSQHTVLMNHWNCSFQSCPRLSSCLPSHRFLYLSPRAAFITLTCTRHQLTNAFQHLGKGDFSCRNSHTPSETVGIQRASWQQDKSNAGFIICLAPPSPLFPLLFVRVLCTSLWIIRFWGKETGSYCMLISSLAGWVCDLGGICGSEWLGVWGYFKGWCRYKCCTKFLCNRGLEKQGLL